MDYLHTHPNAVVRFHASDMILYIESDTAYLVLPQACSRVASIFYLSNATSGRPPLNGAIQVIYNYNPRNPKRDRRPTINSNNLH